MKVSGRLESIQALRAVAAIGVVFTHAITRIARTFPHEANQSLFISGEGGQLTVGDAVSTCFSSSLASSCSMSIRNILAGLVHQQNSLLGAFCGLCLSIGF